MKETVGKSGEGAGRGNVSPLPCAERRRLTIRETLVEVHFGRSTVVQAMMKTFVVIEIEVRSQASKQLRDCFIAIQVNMFIFDRTPQTLNEDVVESSPAAVHADANARLLQAHGEI